MRPEPSTPAAAARRLGRDLGVATGHAVGIAIDRAVTSHHARRLRKVGWSHALDASPRAPASRRAPANRATCAAARWPCRWRTRSRTS